MQSFVGKKWDNLEIVLFALLNLENMLSICLLQDKNSSIKIPMYFIN